MNVVSVMAHQDDELMCLGTMLKMKARGDSLHFICLTGGEMGMVQHPEMSSKEASECRKRRWRHWQMRQGEVTSAWALRMNSYLTEKRSGWL